MKFFMVFLLPSIFGIKVFIHLNDNKKSIDTILDYLCLVLFSNCFCMTIFALSNNLEMYFVSYVQSNYIFSLIYIFLMLVANLFLAVLFTIIRKCFIFSVEVENVKEKKNNK